MAGQGALPQYVVDCLALVARQGFACDRCRQGLQTRLQIYSHKSRAVLCAPARFTPKLALGRFGQSLRNWSFDSGRLEASLHNLCSKAKAFIPLAGTWVFSAMPLSGCWRPRNFRCRAAQRLSGEGLPFQQQATHRAASHQHPEGELLVHDTVPRSESHLAPTLCTILLCFAVPSAGHHHGFGRHGPKVCF